MKKHKKLTATLLFVLLITVLFGFLFWKFFYSLSFLPRGELIDSKECPTCGKIVNVYLVNPGATSDYCIKAELVRNNKTKVIYWNNHESTADVKWIDCKTITINGHILDVDTDVYDFRWEI